MPHYQNNETNQKQVSFKENITCESNIDFTNIKFQPNRSWILYKQTQVLNEKNLIVSIATNIDSAQVVFYPDSTSIQLIEQ